MTLASSPTAGMPSGTRAWVHARRIRLASGLVLFVYVFAHILNLALGNISVDAMQAGVKFASAVWRSWPCSIVLYSALLAHAALGVWALYERRMFRYRRAELPQLILGLAIVFMLVNHIVVTRLAYALYGTNKGYIQELYQFWIVSPFQGFNQAAVLIVAWTHACIGLHFWLRLKRWYKPVAPVLLGLAVLIPALGLLGFYQGGRTILAAAQSQIWRDLNASPVEMGTLAERAALADLRNALLAGFAFILIATFVLRGLRDWRERRGGVATLTYPDRRKIRAPIGISLLEASTRYEMPHAGVCGGRGRCGTCRVAVLAGGDNLPPPTAVERAILERIGAKGSRIRIGCQARPTGDVTFAPMLPPQADPPYVFGKRRLRAGRTRATVCMFVECLEIGASPDLMFRVNRFVEAAIEAVTRAGGEFNRLSGAGILALFDAEGDRARAARQAIDAAAMIGVNVEHLAELLRDAEPMRLAIGIAIGPAVLGDISAHGEVAYTAVGEVVREAERLCEIARERGCEVAYSETLHEAASLPADLFTREIMASPSSGASLPFRLSSRVAKLFGALDLIADASIGAAPSQQRA